MVLLKTTFSLFFGLHKYLNLNTKSHQECNLFRSLAIQILQKYSPDACFSEEQQKNLSLLDESYALALT